jgi:hypothetical protein
MAPEGAAAWVFDRQVLWNTVEAAETRRDSQVAREVEVGLPMQAEILERFSRTPALENSMREDRNRRRAYVRERMDF